MAVAGCLLLAACGSSDVGVQRATDAATPTTAPATAPEDTGPQDAVPQDVVPQDVVPPTTTTASTVLEAGDACPPPLARQAPDPQRPVYDLAVTADPDSGLVTGTQEVAFTPDLAVGTMVFRLWANGPRPASAGTRLDVIAVSEGQVARPTSQPDPTTLVVDLGRRVAPGETVRLLIEWRLAVDGAVNDRISRQAGSLRLGSFVPLLAWQPGVGWATEAATSGFAESTTSPSATWTYTVDAPVGFDVVGTGIRDPNGAFRADAVRDVAVTVGRFTTAQATAMAPGPVTVTVAVHDGVDEPARYLGQLVDQLETMAGWYGPYPWPAYTLSITPELTGGIEFPMHVLQGPGTDGRTTPHEVAHMWFYGLVGNNQALHPWLDEGLATYVEGRVLGSLDSMAAKQIPAAGVGHADEPMTFWESRSSAYYRSVYVQPAAALSRLDAALVDCALARFVAGNAHTIAVPADFERAFDAVFRQWRPALEPAGLP